MLLTNLDVVLALWEELLRKECTSKGVPEHVICRIVTMIEVLYELAATERRWSGLVRIERVIDPVRCCLALGTRDLTLSGSDELGVHTDLWCPAYSHTIN